MAQVDMAYCMSVFLQHTKEQIIMKKSYCLCGDLAFMFLWSLVYDFALLFCYVIIIMLIGFCIYGI